MTVKGLSFSMKKSQKLSNDSYFVPPTLFTLLSYFTRVLNILSLILNFIGEIVKSHCRVLLEINRNSTI